MGLEDHYKALAQQALGDAALFTAQGNAFDHIAVVRRLVIPVTGWLRGDDTLRQRYPTPTAVEGWYQQLRACIQTGGTDYPPMECVAHAFPEDLLLPLLASRSWWAAPPAALGAPADDSRAPGGATLSAAGTGRGAP